MSRDGSPLSGAAGAAGGGGTGRRGPDGAGEPPAVLVAVHDHAPPAVVRELHAGAEEQGIPTAPGGAVTGGDADAGATQLARRAAGESRLEVGVGVGRDGTVAVHHALVPHVLLALDAGAAPARVRTLGGDAARIVAGLPLRTPQRPAPPDGADRVGGTGVPGP